MDNDVWLLGLLLLEIICGGKSPATAHPHVPTCAMVPMPGTVENPPAIGIERSGRIFSASDTTASARGCRHPFSTAAAASRIYPELLQSFEKRAIWLSIGKDLIEPFVSVFFL